jgi:hypothetical protein
MFGREVVEFQEHLTIFLQTRTGFGILDSVEFN